MWASIPITHPLGTSSPGVAPSPAGAQSHFHLALLFPSNAPAPTKAFISGLQNAVKGTLPISQHVPRDAGPEVHASSSQQLSKYILFVEVLPGSFSISVFHFSLGISYSGTAKKFPVTVKPFMIFPPPGMCFKQLFM